MNAATTDFHGLPAAVGAAAPVARWSAEAGATSMDRHQLATRKPMPSNYEVKTINGFDRRPSGGST